MAIVVVAPTNLTAKQKKERPSLYLAGPFDDTDGTPRQQRSWRDDVIDAVADLDVHVFDPRSPRWPLVVLEGEGSGAYQGAYSWQLQTAFDADVVVVWIPAGRKAPTAHLILGHLGAKRSAPGKGSSVVVGGAGVHITFAKRQRLFPMGDDLSEVIRIARVQLAAAGAR